MPFAGTVYKIISNFVRILLDMMQPLTLRPFLKPHFITCQYYEVVFQSIQYEVLPSVQWCYGALLYNATETIMILRLLQYITVKHIPVKYALMDSWNLTLICTVSKVKCLNIFF